MAQAASALDRQCLGSSLLDLTAEMEKFPPLSSVVRAYTFVEYPQVDFYVPEVASNAIALGVGCSNDWNSDADKPEDAHAPS